MVLELIECKSWFTCGVGDGFGLVVWGGLCIAVEKLPIG